MKHFIDQASLNDTSIEYLVYKLNEVIRNLNNKPDIHDLEYWEDYFSKIKAREENLTYEDILEGLKNKPSFSEVREEIRAELTKLIDEINQRIYQPSLEQLLRVIGDSLQEHIQQMAQQYLDRSINDIKEQLSAEIIYWS